MNDDSAVTRLPSPFDGVVLAPGDPGFEKARLVWNGMIDRKPAMVARCRSTSDVSATIRFARRAGLPSRSAVADTTSPGARSPTARS